MATGTYDPGDFTPFAVTVDLAVLTVRNGVLCALVVKRGVSPFAGQLALPGGFVGADEDLLDAAIRELTEETAIRMDQAHLEQLGTYGRPDRDPRMRVVSVAYLALVADLPEPSAGTDASAARWLAVESAGKGRLAFDHDLILHDAVERARSKLEYTTLAVAFCGAEFTITELRRVYEAVWGFELDPRNFHRKVMLSEGFVEETGKTVTHTGGRPAQLYRAGPAHELRPPLVR